MTSSGTYNYSPPNSDLVLNAYGRIQIRKPGLTVEHLLDAETEANLLMVQWSNLQPLLWKSDLISQVLTEGTATYALPASVVMIIIARITTGSDAAQIDRVLGPLSTVEYESIPNKNTQAPPTAFWFNRLIIPEITMWQVPDGNGPYTLNMRVVRQVQDVALANGQTLDSPYRFFDAFAAGLAHRLARIHRPELEDRREKDAEKAWAIAATQDVENTQLSVSPILSGYYR